MPTLIRFYTTFNVRWVKKIMTKRVIFACIPKSKVKLFLLLFIPPEKLSDIDPKFIDESLYFMFGGKFYGKYCVNLYLQIQVM